jgi:hypothetical protein
MPTLPLYALPNRCADASHRVISPGGYEGWYFHAEDPATDTRIVVGLGEGSPFDAAYLKRYRAYRAAPTRRRPPAPSDFPCAYAAVYRGGKMVRQFLSHHAAGSLVASIDELNVRLGPNVMRQTAEGYQIEVQEGVSANLKFAPQWPGREWEGTFPSREVTGADHRWVIAAPLCEVSGSIGADAFKGRGYHDHHYGTGPLGMGLRWWMRGHVLLERRAIAFAVIEASEGAIEGTSVVADDGGIAERSAASWRVEGKTPCPLVIRCGDHLALSNPRIIDSSGNLRRVTYSVQADGEHGTALCNITCAP